MVWRVSRWVGLVLRLVREVRVCLHVSACVSQLPPVYYRSEHEHQKERRPAGRETQKRSDAHLKGYGKPLRPSHSTWLTMTHVLGSYFL